MKFLHLSIITIFGAAILFAFSILNHYNTYEKQISKEECMGGPYCPGAPPIPSASIGNRTLELALKLYSNPTMPSNVHYLWLRFFDANTNQTIQHVSFFLNITENNYSVLHDLFNAPTGILTIKVNSIDLPFNGTVIGDREAILGGWMPHGDEPVVVYAPVFNDDNSTYHLKITMGTIDQDNNIFADQGTAPQFDSHLDLDEQNVTKTIMPTIPSKIDQAVLQKLHLINLPGGDLHLLVDVKLEDSSYVPRLPNDITIVYSKNDTVGMAVDNDQLLELAGLDFVKQITSPNGVFPRDSNATVENPPSPLAQYRAGIVPIYVKCRQGFDPVLMQSPIDDLQSSPACFMWDDETKIQDRGIGKIVNNLVKTRYWDLYGLLPSRMSFSMEPNSSGQIIVKYFPYFNNNMTRDVKPQVFSGYDSNNVPIPTSDISVSANPDAVADNKGQNTTVTYTVNASGVKGLYWLYIPISGCNDVYPLLVGLGTNDVSTVDTAMYVGSETCPSIDMGSKIENTTGVSIKQMLAAPIFN